MLSAIVAWGLAPVATRYLVLQLAPLPLMVIRFLIASLLLLPICIGARRSLVGMSVPRLVAVALLGVIGYYLPVTYGVQRVPASTAGIVLATEPGWILLFAWMVGAERVRRVSWLGVAIAFVGVVFLFVSTAQVATAHQDLLGEALILLAAIMFAAYTIYVRPITRSIGAVRATAISTVLGAVPLLPLIATVHTVDLARLSATAWLALAFLAVGSTVLAMILWNRGVARIGGAEAGPFLNAVPLVSVLGGFLFLSERPSLITLLSGALIIGGVALPQIL